MLKNDLQITSSQFTPSIKSIKSPFVLPIFTAVVIFWAQQGLELLMRRQNQQPQNNSLHPPTSGIWSSLKCISRCHGPAIHTKQKLCDNYAKLCDHCQMSKLFPLASAPTGFEFVSFCTYIKPRSSICSLLPRHGK